MVSAPSIHGNSQSVPALGDENTHTHTHNRRLTKPCLAIKMLSDMMNESTAVKHYKININSDPRSGGFLKTSQSSPSPGIQAGNNIQSYCHRDQIGSDALGWIQTSLWTERYPGAITQSPSLTHHCVVVPCKFIKTFFFTPQEQILHLSWGQTSTTSQSSQILQRLGVSSDSSLASKAWKWCVVTDDRICQTHWSQLDSTTKCSSLYFSNHCFQILATSCSGWCCFMCHKLDL